ncbi:MAG: DUF2059 domain-containing protein [Nevskia sp.]|nr:DUF2059 domain-containing protein [Nevskia sp.]
MAATKLLRMIPAFVIAVMSSTVLQPALADESTPSAASVKELIAVMQSQKLIDSAWNQLDSVMQAGMQQALAGQTITVQQQVVISEMRSKMIAIFKEDMKWEVLEPIFIDIYQKSFSQQEIDGMLAFYKSDTGKAVIAKMPLVMQNSMQAMKGRMEVMAPKLRQLEQDTILQLKAIQKKPN